MLCPQGRRALSVSVRASIDSFGMLLRPGFNNRAQLKETTIQQLLDLPGTRTVSDLQERVDALSSWKLSLQRG